MNERRIYGKVQQLNAARIKRLSRRAGLPVESGRVTPQGNPKLVADALRQLAIELSTPRPRHLPECVYIECEFCANAQACDCAYGSGDADVYFSWECVESCPAR
jgi:hypothetical protein